MDIYNTQQKKNNCTTTHVDTDRERINHKMCKWIRLVFSASWLIASIRRCSYRWCRNYTMNSVSPDLERRWEEMFCYSVGSRDHWDSRRRKTSACAMFARRSGKEGTSDHMSINTGYSVGQVASVHWRWLPVVPSCWDWPSPRENRIGLSDYYLWDWCSHCPWHWWHWRMLAIVEWNIEVTAHSNRESISPRVSAELAGRLAVVSEHDRTAFESIQWRSSARRHQRETACKALVEVHCPGHCCDTRGADGTTNAPSSINWRWPGRHNLLPTWSDLLMHWIYPNTAEHVVRPEHHSAETKAMGWRERRWSSTKHLSGSRLIKSE